MSRSGKRGRWLAVMVITLAAGGGQPAGERVTEVADRLDSVRLEPGDLVFRSSDTWAGRVVRAVDRGTAATHVGIVVDTGPDPLVVHAVPGEGSGDPGGVRAEPVSSYLSRFRARSGSVWRPLATAAQRQQAADASMAALAAGFGFDERFDLSTPHRVYCTELVWRAYQTAGVDLTAGRRDTLRFLGSRLEILLPSTLLTAGGLTQVATVTGSPDLRSEHE